MFCRRLLLYIGWCDYFNRCWTLTDQETCRPHLSLLDRKMYTKREKQRKRDRYRRVRRKGVDAWSDALQHWWMIQCGSNVEGHCKSLKIQYGSNGKGHCQSLKIQRGSNGKGHCQSLKCICRKKMYLNKQIYTSTYRNNTQLPLFRTVWPENCYEFTVSYFPLFTVHF